jgi:energy-coupling factor transport system permease protein
VSTARAVARPLHAAAWWLWALALAAAASRTTNPLLLGLVLVVTGYVTMVRRAATPWAGSYGVFLRLALAVVAIRTMFHIVLGGTGGTTVLVTLPEVPLPDWAQSIRLGGPVSAEGLVTALYDGLRLATLLVCVGAANSLANPKRLLRSLPGALYEVSVAVVVAMTAAPQLVASARQVRRARTLRGDTSRGWRAVRSVLVPVLEDALDRSLTLAAAMDARGYGRTAPVPARQRHLTAALLLLGILGACLGLYGLLDTGAPGAMGGPVLVAGGMLSAAGLVLGGRRVPRTRYRPDQWRRQELIVVLSGVAALAGVLGAEWAGSTDLVPATVPLAAPGLPVVAAVGILVGLVPAWAAPAPAPVVAGAPAGPVRSAEVAA